MKARKIANIKTPYCGISTEDYHIEKRRLQLELLKIQDKLIKKKTTLVVVFEGRDAAGKGSTIKRFTEYLNPRFFKIVSLGIPTIKESKYWFKRYESQMADKGGIIFFDRSWYTRALTEPTMGYCTESQYRYFMSKVLRWEHNLIENGLLLIKFYLSIDASTQLYRFEDRLANPLTFWKFSENDLHARNKWNIFTQYKEQMFGRTSSLQSPWVSINANRKIEARLTSMLHLVRILGNNKFVPLTGEDVYNDQSIKIRGIKFDNLSLEQIRILTDLRDQEIRLQDDKPENRFIPFNSAESH